MTLILCCIVVLTFWVSTADCDAVLDQASGVSNLEAVPPLVDHTEPQAKDFFFLQGIYPSRNQSSSHNRQSNIEISPIRRLGHTSRPCVKTSPSR